MAKKKQPVRDETPTKVRVRRAIARMQGPCLKPGDVATFPKWAADNYIKKGTCAPYISDDLKSAVLAIRLAGGDVAYDHRNAPELADAARAAEQELEEDAEKDREAARIANEKATATDKKKKEAADKAKLERLSNSSGDESDSSDSDSPNESKSESDSKED